MASCTGSPTLRRPPASARPNWTPRVTCPSWTSRQGMTRLASMTPKTLPKNARDFKRKKLRLEAFIPAGLVLLFDRIANFAKRPNDGFMKKLLFVSLALATSLSAQTQIISPDSITGAALGAIIGGIAGGNCHNGGFSGNNAAIGAGIGLAVGTIAGQVRQNQYASAQPQPAYVAASPAYVVTQPAYVVTATGSPAVYTTQYVTYVTNVYP